MEELVLYAPPEVGQREDGWFRWLVVASIVLHSIVLLGGRHAATASTAQAPHQAVTVSLALLQAQDKQQSLHHPVARQQPAHRKPLPVPLRKHKAGQKRPTPLAPAAPTQANPITSEAATAPQLATSVAHGAKTKANAAAQTEQYLSRLLRHIESFKFYPRAAQRRGIQGAVQVSFLLLAHGDIAQLNVSGAHRLLQQAARTAVQQAVPMLPAPKQMQLPFKVSFVMQFQLPDA